MNKKGCEGCASAIFFIIFCVITVFTFQMGYTPPGPVTCDGQVMHPGDRCYHITKKTTGNTTQINTYEQEKAEQENLTKNSKWLFIIPAVIAALLLVYMISRFRPGRKQQQAPAYSPNGAPPYPAPGPTVPLQQPYPQQNPPYPPPSRGNFPPPPQR